MFGVLLGIQEIYTLPHMIHDLESAVQEIYTLPHMGISQNTGYPCWGGVPFRGFDSIWGGGIQGVPLFWELPTTHIPSAPCSSNTVDT